MLRATAQCVSSQAMKTRAIAQGTTLRAFSKSADDDQYDLNRDVEVCQQRFQMIRSWSGQCAVCVCVCVCDPKPFMYRFEPCLFEWTWCATHVSIRSIARSGASWHSLAGSCPSKLLSWILMAAGLEQVPKSEKRMSALLRRIADSVWCVFYQSVRWFSRWLCVVFLSIHT